MRYFPLKHFVCWKPYGVTDAPCLQVFVKLRLCKCGICSKQQPHRPFQVALHDRLDEFLPPIGAMDVAWPENCSFTVSELVEAKQRVKAHALEMTVVGRTLLLTMHLTLGAIDVQDNAPVDCLGYTTFYPFDIQPFKALTADSG